MKTTFTLILMTGSILLSPALVWAQETNSNTNSLPLKQTVKYQNELNRDRALGERAVIPPGVKELMMLTPAQREDIKSIEDEFAETARKYQIANQDAIEGAIEANRAARISKEPTLLQAARVRLQTVWEPLELDRKAAVVQLRRYLTPEQLTILDDPKNQWREMHGTEANDPSANN